jgi:hypothetical protein
MAAQYPPTYDRFSSLVYQTIFSGIWLSRPVAAIASGNAAPWRGSGEPRRGPDHRPAAAFVEGISTR